MAESRHSRFSDILRRARIRGTVVHADCHAYDDNDLDWATVDERIAPYVMAWAQLRREVGLVPLTRERRIFHPTYWYAGILDGIFGLGGRIILGDIKTGDPEDARADIQTAAYATAWNYENPKLPVTERWAIWLRPDRRVPYTIINYSARPDAASHFGIFMACLTVYREQRKR